MPEAQIIANPPPPPDEVKTDALTQLEIQSAAKHPEWYFVGSKHVFKILRFLNLLEPDRVVLSMTKVMLWAATFQTILVISTSNDVLTVVGALGLNVATMVKHEKRRSNGTTGEAEGE